MQTKLCYNCNKTRQVKFFAKNKSRKDGYNSQCKDCQKLYKDNWYRNNKKHHMKISKCAERIRHAALKSEINHYKISCGCQNCSYNFSPAALDFHHIDDTFKEANISTMLKNSVSRTKIWQEIKKCIVLCANCHREEHHGPFVYEKDC